MSLKFSQDIKTLLAKLADQPLRIAEILRETSERGFSLIIGLLALPFLFPMPPGLSGVMGVGCFCLAMQMAMGRQLPWLPQKVAELQFPRDFSRQLLKNVEKATICLEKITRPRWRRIANNSYTWRTNGFCIAWLSILLMLPIPFTNPLPAVGILLLTVSTLEEDGLLMFVGYALTLLNTLFFGFIGYALWQTPYILPSFLK